MQKPADNEMQREFFGTHKARHFAKPMILTAVDGRIIDLFSGQNGPYPGSISDADILIDHLEMNKE